MECALRFAGALRSPRGRGPQLGEDPLEPRLGLAVDVDHRLGDRRVDGGDLGVHLVRDRAVAGMTLASGPQLDQLHRLAGVEIQDVADPVAEAQRVRGGGLEAGVHQALVLARESSSARR